MIKERIKDMTEKGHHYSIKKTHLIFAVAFLGILILVISYMIISRMGGQEATDFAEFVVKKGPLTISVIESGTIKARDQIIIKNEVEGKTSIIWLIPEGRTVKEGDLLVELDSSQLLDSKIEQQIRVQNAEASFIGTRENLAVVRNQAKSDVDNAELEYSFAIQDIKKYKEGEYPNELKEAESRITLANEELRRAEERLEWSKRLYNEKYISQIELQADELSAKSKGLELELAENNLNLLKDFVYPKRIMELESGVKQKEMSLDRIKRKTKADIIQAEADLKAKESEYERQKDRLSKIEKQIEKTKIFAPSDGLVIYATSARSGGRFSREEPLSEGQMVQERQELIYLPTTASVNAEIGIHETSLKKVKPGMPVKITVDALPGRIFNGQIDKIAVLPDAQSSWLNPDLKVYDAEVVIDGDGSSLRSGMNCFAEIIIDKYDNAIFIPIQAVVKIAGKFFVYVKEGKEFKPREVEIGLDNNKMVRVIKGIAPDEIVLLTPPFDITEEESASQIPPESAAGEGEMPDKDNKINNIIKGGQESHIMDANRQPLLKQKRPDKSE